MISAKIFELLDQNIHACEDVVHILREEEEALRRMDVQAIVDLSRRKHQCLSLIDNLDNVLGDMVDRTGGHVPSPSNAATPRRGKVARKIHLTALLARATAHEVSLLQEKRAALARTRLEIADRNLVNRRFTADVLGYLRDSITFINDAIGKEASYGTGDTGKKGSRPPAFISREV